MNAPVQVQPADVVLTRDQVAAIFVELRKRHQGDIAGADFTAMGFYRADEFIRTAHDLRCGLVETLTPPAAVRARHDEHRLDADQAHALEVLERLADGDRFLLEEDRLGRALQHWITEGVAAKDEEGYFLTAAGRTFCERTLG